MQYKKLFISISFASIVFIGCGGGGGDNASFTTQNDGTAIVSCSNTLNNWTQVTRGDVVVGDLGAILKFDHDSDNIKRVCVQEGTAYIIEG